MLKSKFSIFGSLLSIAVTLYSSLALAQYPKGRNIKTDFALISTIVGNSSFIREATEADYFDSRREASECTKCIFAEKGHFYWKNAGVIYDSYQQGWQRPGSNNFCQTFAQLGYLGQVDGLEQGPDARLQNSRVALQYWFNQAALIRAYWSGVMEVLEESDEYQDQYEVFSQAKKPSSDQALRKMIDEMIQLSDEDLLSLITTEEIE